MPVAGVDVAKLGWVAVVLDGGRPTAQVAADFEAVLGQLEAARIICVDIPIGLPSSGFRPIDQEAKKLLGPRRNSVFLTPPRPVLEAKTHSDAVRVCEELTGKGISQQAWALGPKIIQVDALAQRQPERIREGHPEVTFWALNGRRPLAYAKRTWNGLMQRRRLLLESGIELPDDLGETGVVAADDVLDAAALAWTATRIASKEAIPVPNPPHEEDGRTIAIWF